MRILVLQLARFGDIYQSWPTFQALKRKHPGCELHVLVRARFQEGMAGFPGVTVHAFPTQEFLRPILEADNTESAVESLLSFILPLADMKFDLIVNLSFSPMSSYLTDFLNHDGAEVKGYTRHADGPLQIPDDTSAYFYAQVGIDRANRYHITDVFAAVAGVDLLDEDYVLAERPGRQVARDGIVVHLGASRADKTYSPELWIQALTALTKNTKERIVLVGSNDERKLSETVFQQAGNSRMENRVGETSLAQLFSLIARAKLLIGADSAPVHIATLTGTQVLNLSSAKVNFWETGPLTPESRILYAKDLQHLKPETVASHAIEMLNGVVATEPCFVKDSYREPYRATGIELNNFSWKLIEALYTGTPYPTAETHEDKIAFQRLYELAELALQQLDRWQFVSSQNMAAKILDQLDSLLPDIAKLNPRIEPVVQWFQTQRLRIPPGTDDETLARTRSAFQDLLWVAAVYRQFGNLNEEMNKAIQLCKECAPELREYNFNQVNGSFQTLLSTVHELSRHSTKVAELNWSSVLHELNSSLEKQDFISLADFMQWKLAPALERTLNEKETFSQDVLS